MPDSYIDQKTDLMHQLLWNAILRDLVIGGLASIAAFLQAIPVIGTLLGAIFIWPPTQAIVLNLVSTFLEERIFRALVKWGLFTSIDWKEDAIYAAYEKKAIDLLPELGGKPYEKWTEEDEKKFHDAAADLIELHIPGWGKS